MSDFCDPMGCNLPGSSDHGILWARILEWVAISFSRGSSWPSDQTRVSCVAGRFFTNWATREAPHREISLCICISPPFWASLPPHPHPTSLGHLWASSWSPRVMQQFPTSIYFTHGNEYTLKLLFQFIPHSPSPPAPTSPFSVEESCVHSKDFIQGSFW